MTDDGFEDIIAMATDPTGFDAAVREATAELLRETPSGVDTVTIGHRAWKQLTPVQQAHALDGLFHAYVMRLGDEDRYDQIAQAAAAVKTYLNGEEEIELHRALGEARPIGDDTTVIVSAVDLSNVLDELVLLRHRLHMATTQDGR